MEQLLFPEMKEFEISREYFDISDLDLKDSGPEVRSFQKIYQILRLCAASKKTGSYSKFEIRWRHIKNNINLS